MAAHSSGPVGPTKRQAEYLAFIRAFTERWGIPPAFDDIARHFMTTAPSVNSMVKTLHERGFITRIPGQARTLRVVVPEARPGPPGLLGSTARDDATDAQVKAAVQFASLVVERLVPALKGLDDAHLGAAFDAVRGALEATCLAAGASDKQRRAAHDTLLRVVMVAQGMSTETRPGRTLPWWHKVR